MRNFSVRVPASRWHEIVPALKILYELKSCAFLGPSDPFERDLKPGGPFAYQLYKSNGELTGDVMFYIVGYPNERKHRTSTAESRSH